MRLIVTNGDMAAERLRDAGGEADILPWRDVLHDGPVPDEGQLEALSRLRASYLAEEFGIPLDQVSMSFAERDSTIRQHRRFDRIEIWLEHDLYDQLQLIQILDFLAREGRMEDVHLVQSDDHFGKMSDEGLQELAAAAIPVTEAQFELAGRAWAAFTAPYPGDLAALAEEDLTALPYLGPALLRVLSEYPDPIRGLSLTEERMLQRLIDGPATTAELFRTVADQEDAQFMSDASFFRRVDALVFARAPLVKGLDGPFKSPLSETPDYADSEVCLTRVGRGVMDGKVDHAMVNDPMRWIGGTRLRPAAVMLRYDRKQKQLIGLP